jgi:hypothetical protein
MSMDLTPLLSGAEVSDPQPSQKVSLFFGLAVLLASYLADLLLGAKEGLRFLGLPVRDAGLLGRVEHAGSRRSSTGSPTG